MYKKETIYCKYLYIEALNKIPLNECGTAIYITEGETPEPASLPPADFDANDPPHEFIEKNSFWFYPEYDDFDNDGLSNWFEYIMGLNPCTENSFGNCIHDGDLDYDGDGIPNEEDDYPICNDDDYNPPTSECWIPDYLSSP